MQTEHLEVSYPAGLEQAVEMTKQEFAHHLRLMAALKMFELGKLSSGKAAELAGLSRTEFLETCGRYQVSVFNYPDADVDDELRRDVETLRNLAGE